MVVAFAIGNDDHTTPPFSLREPLSTLLSLGNKFGAVHVDCRISGRDQINWLHHISLKLDYITFTLMTTY